MSFDGIKRAALERITAGSEGARLIGSQLTGVTGNNIQVLLEALLARVLPSGGTTGQVLKKTSGTDYATSWQAESATTPASETVSGVAEIATQTEADAGTDDARIMTPLKVASRPQKNTVFETFIHGLTLQWNSPGTNANNITVTSGSAWIPSLGKIYNVSSSITGPSQTFSANTWYHVYLYDNSGTPAIEVVTTAPAAAYKGTARTKTSDTSRRYIGSVKSNGDATPRMLDFRWNSFMNLVEYLENTIAAPFELLSGGTATTDTSVDASGICPVTAESIYVNMWNSSATVNLYVNSSGTSAGSSGSNGQYVAKSNNAALAIVPLSSTQTFLYHNHTTGGSSFLYGAGYVVGR